MTASGQAEKEVGRITEVKRAASRLEDDRSEFEFDAPGVKCKVRKRREMQVHSSIPELYTARAISEK
jgi:hypothetical protein